jgi:Fe-S-cluster-containing dehydrogenase component
VSMEFFIDPSRCIGCQACAQACAECDSHRGIPMIHLDFVDRSSSPQTTPTVCMHCDDPTCARVCPTDAIKQTAEGVVQSALKPRCVGCSNCVLACPFGVPRYIPAQDQMMKCDMCYDRTSAGLKPMCATVCPSGALSYGPREAIVQMRRERPTNTFVFGRRVVTTKVNLMVSANTSALEVDIASFLPPPEEPGADSNPQQVAA